MVMYIADTLLKVNTDILIQGLSNAGIFQVSFGCTGIDLPVRLLKDPSVMKSKLKAFFPLPGEDLEG
jgi:hypothetical protein